MINDANIVATDVMASNGVIHVIDAVILPAVLAAASAAQMTNGISARRMGDGDRQGGYQGLRERSELHEVAIGPVAGGDPMRPSSLRQVSRQVSSATRSTQ